MVGVGRGEWCNNGWGGEALPLSSGGIQASGASSHPSWSPGTTSTKTQGWPGHMTPAIWRWFICIEFCYVWSTSYAPHIFMWFTRMAKWTGRTRRMEPDGKHDGGQRSAVPTYLCFLMSRMPFFLLPSLSTGLSLRGTHRVLDHPFV